MIPDELSGLPLCKGLLVSVEVWDDDEVSDSIGPNGPSPGRFVGAPVAFLAPGDDPETRPVGVGREDTEVREMGSVSDGGVGGVVGVSPLVALSGFVLWYSRKSLIWK